MPENLAEPARCDCKDRFDNLTLDRQYIFFQSMYPSPSDHLKRALKSSQMNKILRH